MMHDWLQRARVRQQLVEMVFPSRRARSRFAQATHLGKAQHLADAAANTIHGLRRPLPFRLDHLDDQRGIDVADCDIEQRLGVGCHAVAPLASMLATPAVAMAIDQLVEHLLEAGGVQLGGASGHTFGIAVADRIDTGRQQFSGLIGLGAGLGERDYSRRDP